MGIYSIKENLYAEFAQQKTKPKKVKWLQELKVFRETHPQEFRGNKITVKNIENLIEAWSQKNPQKYVKDKLGITAREERERLAEMAKRDPKDDE
jgi:hypothetical protein|tara:strand:- start:63 stop:347 length:285 start_codon:yes stop_codon:yes gene_type:complete